MDAGYFHRVHEQTLTRLWINNPTLEESAKVIEAGAVSCTTNPTFVMKIYKQPEEKSLVDKDLKEAVSRFSDDEAAAAAVQRAAVKRVAEAFLPVYEKSNHKDGWVSIQISPHREDDADNIIRDAHENLKLAPNIIAKIPTTVAGLAAMKVLMAENVPIIATEIMGIAQAVAVCEMYRDIAEKKKINAPLYVTHISGIFDDYLKSAAAKLGAKISPDLLFQAGCSLARRQYRIMKDRKYPGILLGGGARGLHHFTEMVGGDAHVTINWKGSAETLIKENPPVISRMETPVPEYVVEGLLNVLPDFKRAYREDGLKPEEFAGFGPVVLFRNMFIEGWDFLLELVKTKRG